MVTFTQSDAGEIRDGVVRATWEGIRKVGLEKRGGIVRTAGEAIVRVAGEGVVRAAGEAIVRVAE